jgi:PAS domain S-box-containing protein
MNPDWEALFRALPGPYLALLPDDPVFTIVAVNAAYAQVTHTRPEAITGHALFESFPDNPADPGASGVRNLHASLRRVIASKAMDKMPVQRYDIRLSGEDGMHFEERYWSPVNAPVLAADGSIAYILHRSEDVTDFVRLQRRESEQGQLTHELQLRADRMEAELFLRSHELAQSRQISRDRQLLSLFAEHSPNFIGISDLQGSAEYFNPAAMTLVGARDLEDVRRRHVVEYVLPEQRSFVQDVVIPTIRENGRWQGELLLQHLTNGESIPVYCDAFRVDDPATGQPTHIATVVRDLRERKAAERRNALLVQLDDAIRPISDSHQLVQTVTSLLGGHLKVNACVYAPVNDDQETFDADGDYFVGLAPRIEHYRFSQFGAAVGDRLRDGRTAVISDAEKDDHAATARPFYRLTGIRAAIFTPVLAAGHLAAVLLVHQSEAREWKGERRCG